MAFDDNNAPSLFDSLNNAPPVAEVRGIGADLKEGIDRAGDAIIAWLDGAMGKIVGGAKGLLSGGMGGGEAVFSTGRYEDPGFSPSAPIVAAASPAMVKGQSIEAPQISAPSRDIVSDANLGQLMPNVPFHKALSQERGNSLG